MKIKKSRFPVIIFFSVLVLFSVLNLLGIVFIPPKAHEFAVSGRELPQITLVTINILNFLRPIVTRIVFSLVFAFVAWKYPKYAIRVIAGVAIPISALILIGALYPYF